MVKLFNKMLNLINYNIKLYKLFVIVDYNKLNLQMCNLLEKQGYILYYYYYLKDNKIIIYLKYYNNIKVLRYVKPYTNKTGAIYCKVIDLYSRHYTFSNFILTTTRGLLTISQAKELNLGGRIIMLIH